jgi:hypothetical protein
MIELVFVVCLAAAEDTCAERSLLFVPEAGLAGCMATAQPQLAQWVEAHPDLRIARWRCRWAETADRRA